jgi:uncharacterized protein
MTAAMATGDRPFLWHTTGGRLLFLLLVTASSIVFALLAQRWMTDVTDVLSLGTVCGLLATGLPVALATLHLRMRGESWARFGLRRPESWPKLMLQVVLVIVAAIVLFLLAVAPVARWTGAQPDISHLLPLQGNLPALLWALAAVWITAALFEEMFARGYLLNEIKDLLGGGRAALAAGVVLSSLLFGLGHLYQGMSGVVITGMVGSIFAVAYLLCGRNLWPVIIAHGVINSITLVQIYMLPAQ